MQGQRRNYFQFHQVGQTYNNPVTHVFADQKQLGDKKYYPQMQAPAAIKKPQNQMFQFSPSGMNMNPSPMNIVDDLQKKGVTPLVVVIQMSEPTNHSSHNNQTPTKSVLPDNQASDTSKVKRVNSNTLFDVESALSPKDETDNLRAKSEFDKPND